RIVDVPRLVAGLPDDGPGHPVIAGLAEALTAHYGRSLHRVSLAAYRDGRDSVAFHGDKLGAARNDAIVAIVGLGARRRFLLRPAGGGRSPALDLGGGGPLLVGGPFQRTWGDGVPQGGHAALGTHRQFRSAPTAPYPPSLDGSVEEGERLGAA